MISDDEMLQRLDTGAMVEDVSEMSPTYLRELKRTLLISADTEFLGAVMYYPNLVDGRVPDKMQGAVLAIIQDELGHAHIDYRMLEDLGENIDHLLYERAPSEFKHPYAMDMPYESFNESVVVGSFMDRAGYILLSDIFENTSYAPWRRALVKVNKEEHFHISFGVRNLEAMAKDPDQKALTQRAIDWMFPMTVEWFGLPDSLKTANSQLRYRLKGKTNDQLRQEWLGQVVPLMERLGFHVPAHHDAEFDTYVLDFPLPCRFDAAAKLWDFDDPCTWDDVLVRWRGRGPWNERLVSYLQSGRLGLDALSRSSGAA
jgi:ring-1,2-phenylacetyl-CoA epoxidase subunit PaaA